MDRNFGKDPTMEGAGGSPPSEAWLVGQALLGKPIPNPYRANDDALTERKNLEWLARISSRHADELRKLRWAEAEARHERKMLEWMARFSTRHADELRTVLREEAAAREAQERWEWFYEAYIAREAQWNPADHPRAPKGQPDGGQWVDKDGGGGAAGTASEKAPNPGAARSDSVPPVQPPATKSHLPADHRGTWISGTKGHGIFRYNYSLENHEAGVAGKEVRFENQHIAIGGFPPEAYYGGNASSASVEIEAVTGLEADARAADAAMRKKLGNPGWQRPEGYRWNHAGQPGSKTMELVQKGHHAVVAHKGPGAVPRAQMRTASARGATGRAMGALTVYLVARDALQAGGLLKPDYEVAERETYHFRAKDGSVFVVHLGGLFSSAERRYVAGPRKGQTEKITKAEVEQYRKQAEQEFGKYVPGSLFTEPRFIPGRQRTSLPLIIHKYGIPHKAGWIDEKGVHRYPVPRPLPI